MDKYTELLQDHNTDMQKQLDAERVRKALISRILQAGDSQLERINDAINKSDQEMVQGMDLDDKVHTWLSEGGKIHAIKMLRSETGYTLSYSKMLVEEALDKC